MKNWLILIGIFSHMLYAQSNIDSLWTEYHKVVSDTQKVNILTNEILPLYTRQHSDSGLKYYKYAINNILNFFKKENNKNLKLFYAHNLLKVVKKTGDLYYDIGNNKISLNYYHTLYKLCKIIQKYYPYDFETYAYVGEYYLNRGSYYNNISKDSTLYFYNLALLYFKMLYRFDSLSNKTVDGL